MVWLIFATLMGVSSLLVAYPVPVDFDGELLRWPIKSEEDQVLFEVEGSLMDLEDFRPMVQISADLWSSVAGSQLRLRAAGLEEKAQITLKLKQSLENNPYAAGYAFFDEKLKGVPQHCLIEILADRGYGDYAIAKAILHELGHCIGLGHSMVPEAIMSYALDQNDFNLDLDDEAAVAHLYSEKGRAQLPPGCAQLGTEDPKVLRKPQWFFLLLLPLWLSRAKD